MLLRRTPVQRAIFAVLGAMALTGCPYTEGCEASSSAPTTDVAPTEPAAVETEGGPGYIPNLDGGGTDSMVDGGAPGTIDLGADPGGGPALSTLSCPALSMPAAAPALTVYVDAKATGAQSGTKTAPFRTIAQAFASAPRDGIVWVTAGSYKESLAIPNKDLVVHGGFAPGFGSRTNACGTILEAANVSQPVLVASDEVKTFGMDGLWIQKGARGLSVQGDYAAPPTFTIARCVFSENGKTSDVGGAVALDNVNATIFGSVFRDNRAAKGAAIGASGNVTVDIDQNLFDRNLGYADHGGGLYLSTKSTKIFRNTFRANATGVGNAGGWGGAVIVYKSGAQAAHADFAFNVFTENVAGIGGAVFVDDGATITMSHDLLYRNRSYPENGMLRGAAIYVDGTGLGPAGGSTLTADYLTVVDNNYDDKGNPGTASFGGNVYVEGYSKAFITNSIFWNNGNNAFFVDSATQNELSISNSIGQAVCTTANANGFVTASAAMCKMGSGVFQPPAIYFVDEANDDFHEQSTAGHYSRNGWVLDAVTSPAIDKADPAADIGPEPMPNGGRSNIGAFACTSEASKSP